MGRQQDFQVRSVWTETPKASVIKEGKAEAKGYPLPTGGVQKSSKKIVIQLASDGTMTFLDGSKADYILRLSSLLEITVDHKKKKISIVVDAETTISIDPDEDVSSWHEAMVRVTPPKYFGIELAQLCKTPTEIPVLVEHSIQNLTANIESEGIFRVSGSKNEVEAVKRMYDGNNKPADLMSYDVNTVTGLFKLFLRSLPTPLIPFNYYNAFINAANARNSSDIAATVRPLILELPLQNQVLLKVIINFLAKVTTFSAKNQMVPSNLAICVGPNMIRPAIESIEAAQQSQHIIMVVTAMIEHPNSVFEGVPDHTPASVVAMPPPSSLPPPPTMLPPPPSNMNSLPPSLAPPVSLPPPPGSLPPSLPPPMDSASLPPTLPNNPVPPSPNAGGPPQFAIPKGDLARGLRPVSQSVAPGKLPSLPSGSLPPLKKAPPKNPLPPPQPIVSSASHLNNIPLPVPAGGAGNPEEAKVASSGPETPTKQLSRDVLAQIVGRQPGHSPDSIGKKESLSDSVSNISKSHSMVSLRSQSVAVGARPPSGTFEMPPPLESPVKDPKTPKESKDDDDTEESSEAAQWKTYETDDGRKYYHNEVTNTTVWEKPEVLKKKVKKHRKAPSNAAGIIEAKIDKEKVAPKDNKEVTASNLPAALPSDSALQKMQSAIMSKADRRKSYHPGEDRESRRELSSSSPSVKAIEPRSAAELKAEPKPETPHQEKGEPDRIRALEERIAALERIVEEQGTVIEGLLASRSRQFDSQPR